MYEAKIVTGGTYPETEYDEENVLRHSSLSEAVSDALANWAVGRTWDVILEEDGERLARVHPDGGIDYYPAARGHGSV